MISYADLEFAIARWKARATGAAQAVVPVTSGMVEGEIPVANPPEATDVSLQSSAFESRDE